MDFLETVKAGRGALLLDALVPGWWKNIDIIKLRLSSSVNCILGQIFGSYGKGLNELDLDNDGPYYGFQEDNSVTHAQLTREWRLLITNRRNAEASRKVHYIYRDQFPNNLRFHSASN